MRYINLRFTYLLTYLLTLLTTSDDQLPAAMSVSGGRRSTSNHEIDSLV